jgi:hypothetical protein
MNVENNFWRTARWPLLVIVLACLGVATAIVVDMTLHSEWTLTVGALSLGMLLPVGVIWLVATVIGSSTRKS